MAEDGKNKRGIGKSIIDGFVSAFVTEVPDDSKEGSSNMSTPTPVPIGQSTMGMAVTAGNAMVEKSKAAFLKGLQDDPENKLYFDLTTLATEMQQVVGSSEAGFKAAILAMRKQGNSEVLITKAADRILTDLEEVRAEGEEDITEKTNSTIVEKEGLLKSTQQQIAETQEQLAQLGLRLKELETTATTAAAEVNQAKQSQSTLLSAMSQAYALIKAELTSTVQIIKTNSK